MRGALDPSFLNTLLILKVHSPITYLVPSLGLKCKISLFANTKHHPPDECTRNVGVNFTQVKETGHWDGNFLPSSFLSAISRLPYIPPWYFGEEYMVCFISQRPLSRTRRCVSCFFNFFPQWFIISITKYIWKPCYLWILRLNLGLVPSSHFSQLPHPVTT